MPRPRPRSVPEATPFSSLPSELKELCAAAQAVRKHAYAPYSGFRVGAAVRGSDGRLFAGANVENASYGLSVCAERSAVLAAALAGTRELKAVAVCSDLEPPAAPCGMCRQTLAEFASDCEVVLCGPEEADPAVVRMRLSELLPHAFSPASLHAFAEQQQARQKRGGEPRHGR
jgi:cytidine deaminase